MIRRKEHLKMFHRYWSEEFQESFKVINIELIDNIEYYTIRSGETGLLRYIPYPINHKYSYELLVDYHRIGDRNNIINKIYTGAEIKFWFTLHKVNYQDKCYSILWNYLDPTNKNFIKDSKQYKIIIVDKQYIPIQITKNNKVKEV
jgi:hypothetical protein